MSNQFLTTKLNKIIGEYSRICEQKKTTKTPNLDLCGFLFLVKKTHVLIDSLSSQKKYREFCYCRINIVSDFSSLIQ